MPKSEKKLSILKILMAISIGFYIVSIALSLCGLIFESETANYVEMVFFIAGACSSIAMKLVQLMKKEEENVY
jgi:hypothetical protein